MGAWRVSGRSFALLITFGSDSTMKGDGKPPKATQVELSQGPRGWCQAVFCWSARGRSSGPLEIATSLLFGSFFPFQSSFLIDFRHSNPRSVCSLRRNDLLRLLRRQHGVLLRAIASGKGRLEGSEFVRAALRVQETQRLMYPDRCEPQIRFLYTSYICLFIYM